MAKAPASVAAVRSVDLLHLLCTWLVARHLKHCRSRDGSSTALQVDHPTVMPGDATTFFPAGHRTQQVPSPLGAMRIPPLLTSMGEHAPNPATASAISSGVTESSRLVIHISTVFVGRDILTSSRRGHHLPELFSESVGLFTIALASHFKEERPGDGSAETHIFDAEGADVNFFPRHLNDFPVRDLVCARDRNRCCILRFHLYRLWPLGGPLSSP